MRIIAMYRGPVKPFAGNPICTCKRSFAISVCAVNKIVRVGMCNTWLTVSHVPYHVFTGANTTLSLRLYNTTKTVPIGIHVVIVHRTSHMMNACSRVSKEQRGHISPE